MTGTERKVFQKYYPPDFDPSKIPRAKGQRNRQFVQRVMTPFNMQCNSCHEYIYKGKKFNMKRETVEGETYLGLRLFRFYFRCPNCLAEITFKTDLEHCDYQQEHGATRLFEAVKLYQDQEKQREAKEEEDAKDPMKMLEKRTMMSRLEMEAIGNLEDLQESSRHKEGVNVDEFLTSTDPHLAQAMRIKRQEEEDDRLAREMLGKTADGRIERRIKEEDSDEELPKPKIAKLEDKKPQPAKKNDQRELLSKIVMVKKKKVEKDEVEVKKEAPDEKPDVIVKSEAGPSTSGLTSLVDYGSDSD
ncbi:unnamed protein product [Caenorhabditis auriculariae]|uniref:Splicing factor YJU2 n=1 Tax=Caenorhabditis auriculariae TaxID=2777116 RepID=A0A8S1GX58_9PELO|nr:unnamed protein product [Caenorhabditis auriculariae]